MARKPQKTYINFEADYSNEVLSRPCFCTSVDLEGLERGIWSRKMFPVLTLSSLDAVYRKNISLFQGKTFCIINNGL